VKLPHKGDPGGDAEGALERRNVLDALHQQGVTIAPREDGLTDLSKPGVDPISLDLSDPVSGTTIRYIARALELDRLKFYTYRPKGLH